MEHASLSPGPHSLRKRARLERVAWTIWTQTPGVQTARQGSTGGVLCSAQVNPCAGAETASVRCAQQQSFARTFALHKVSIGMLFEDPFALDLPLAVVSSDSEPSCLTCHLRTSSKSTSRKLSRRPSLQHLWTRRKRHPKTQRQQPGQQLQRFVASSSSRSHAESHATGRKEGESDRERERECRRRRRIIRRRREPRAPTKKEKERKISESKPRARARPRERSLIEDRPFKSLKQIAFTVWRLFVAKQPGNLGTGCLSRGSLGGAFSGSIVRRVLVQIRAGKTVPKEEAIGRGLVVWGVAGR